MKDASDPQSNFYRTNHTCKPLSQANNHPSAVLLQIQIHYSGTACL